ncbi:hypothetical protein IJ732_04165 [bacterium]|nr:hypothetical protein [bacterium]
MEIKATLQKPYDEIQRLEFIVENNHNQGYELRETDEELQAWGYTVEELNQQEAERVNNLKITKREFALCLQKMGITYVMLKELIAANEQAQLEWDLCVELQRSNPLLDKMAGQLGLSSEQLDLIFKKLNGDNTNLSEAENV